jgi:hypothetical protein
MLELKEKVIPITQRESAVMGSNWAGFKSDRF